MKWQDVKLAVLQKMFSAEGTAVNENDEGVKEYVNAMPQAANEGLQMLCTVGKYLRRCYEFKKNSGRFTLDLKEELSDFYEWEGELYRIAEDGAPEAVRGAQLVAGRYLLVPANVQGNLQFWYNAWPPPITHATSDDTELELDPEAAVLLPLYIASQLYKDDDISIATMYRNEFETALERLQQTQSGVQGEGFTSVTGWV